MRTKTILPLILFLSLAALSQDHAAMQGMSRTGASIIDGAQHPELIPDSTAYRLYFATVAEMPAEMQQAQLSSSGLSPAEIAPAVAAIQQFKSRWDALRDAYNQAVEAEAPVNLEDFLSRRDRLVEELLAKLRAAVTPEGFGHLQTRVQFEKRRMKVSAAN